MARAAHALGACALLREHIALKICTNRIVAVKRRFLLRRQCNVYRDGRVTVCGNSNAAAACRTAIGNICHQRCGCLIKITITADGGHCLCKEACRQVISLLRAGQIIQIKREAVCTVLCRVLAKLNLDLAVGSALVRRIGHPDIGICRDGRADVRNARTLLQNRPVMRRVLSRRSSCGHQQALRQMAHRAVRLGQTGRLIMLRKQR